MKIGIISDTHGSLIYFEKAMDHLKDCEMILHAGDVLYHGYVGGFENEFSPVNLALTLHSMKNIVFAAGNCDRPNDETMIGHPLHAPYTVLELGLRKIFLCHGNGDHRMGWIDKAKKFGADILICGHTHIKEITKYENLIVLNPGSTTLPRDGIRSAAIIDQNDISLINIDNGERLQTVEF